MHSLGKSESHQQLQVPPSLLAEVETVNCYYLTRFTLI